MRNQTVKRIPLNLWIAAEADHSSPQRDKHLIPQVRSREHSIDVISECYWQTQNI